MIFTVNSQIYLFAQSVLFGLLLSFLYTVFSLIRINLHFGRIAVFFTDLMYFFICTAASILFFFIINDGKIRLFIILSVILSWILFYNTIGRLIMTINKKMYDFCRKKLSQALEKRIKM